MNILFINNFRGRGVYGIELWMMKSCLLLARRGHSAFLACRPGLPLSERACSEGVAIIDYDPRRGIDGQTIRLLRSMYRQHNIEVVCVKTYRDLRNAKLAALGLPVRIFCRRGNMFDIKNNLRHILNLTLLRPQIVVPSEGLKEEFSSFWWLNPARIHVHHHGIDASAFVPSGESSHTNGPSYQALFVGRLCPDKGIDVLLQAWRRVLKDAPHSRLALVGGMEEMDYPKMARDLGVDTAVDFCGYQADVRPWMWRSELLVLPSRREGAAYVLLEAMAAGLPVVASRLSSVGEYIAEGECGVLVPPDNADELAHALLSFIRDPGKVRSFGNAGRVRVANRFGLDAATERLERLLAGYPS